MTDTDATRLPEREFDALMADIRHDRERFHAFLDGFEAAIDYMEGDETRDRDGFEAWVREEYRKRVTEAERYDDGGD